jgi:hypothetical protein
MNNTLSVRDKAILIGLYLSKFDEAALTALGFDGFKQAFNTLGYSIGFNPSSIKNYRDEFDPLFPNPRKGWHNRPLREYCKIIYDEFSSLSLLNFTDLIKNVVVPNYEIEHIINKITKQDKSESIAKRLITGKAAEEYFKKNYSKIDPFIGYELKDTTSMACGFDFKLALNSDYFCIEVKGLNLSSGSIIMTEKEYSIADGLKNKYCLFVVMNFIDKPYHKLYFNPLSGDLKFKRLERPVIQVNYSTSV